MPICQAAPPAASSPETQALRSRYFRPLALCVNLFRNQVPVTLLKSKSPHRKTLRRRLLIIALLCLSVSLLLLTLAGTTASREEGLRLGSTTYSAEFDRDDSQDEWFDFHSRENSTSSHRRLSVGLPFGLLTIESDYYPGDALRKRLPRDVPSLIKHLAAKNRFEVKVAA